MKKILNSLLRKTTGTAIARSAGPWHTLFEKEPALWSSAKKNAVHGKRVLIATSMGCYEAGVVLESLLAVALTLRGARVSFFLCDNLLPVCQMTKISSERFESVIKTGVSRRCGSCPPKGEKTYGPIGLDILWYSRFVSPEDIRLSEEISGRTAFGEISKFKLNGISVGEHAYAGALRFYGRGDIEDDSHSEKIVRLYLKAALLAMFAMEGLLKKHKFDCVVFHHGIYVPQGLIGEVCRREQVRVVNWNHSYRRQTFIFSHDNSYHHTMIAEPTSHWEDLAWTPQLEDATMRYLKSRWHGTEDWIWFHEKPLEDINKIIKTLGVDPSKPCIGMLTNVMWDAQLHYKSNAFENMLDWVLQTINYFIDRHDLQLIIRVHPAEIRGLVPSRQKLADEIKKVFHELPENVFIIPPESEVSTYSVMEACDAVIIYNTKTGIELSSIGIPVIVAGEAWIRNKGFSLDASSPGEYFKILDKLPLRTRLGEKELLMARKYAFHFFFRRMVPLKFITSPEKFKFAVETSSLQELLPGKNKGLDVICEGILKESPFLYPAEEEIL